MKAPVDAGNTIEVEVAAIVLEPTLAPRFGLALLVLFVELFAEAFVAVVFAIRIYLYPKRSAAMPAKCAHTKKDDSTVAGAGSSLALLLATSRRA